MTAGMVVAAAAIYLLSLFAIAYLVDTIRGSKRLPSSIYILSLGVYCTSWTFFGSVGRAAQTGLDFVTIYLGPTLLCCLGPLILKPMLQIAKRNRVTSIADFIASRYGKDGRIAAMVALIAVVGCMPYIALQLKAVSTSFEAVAAPARAALGETALPIPHFLKDSALWSSLLLALFSILFGTRHLDVGEHHRGMVAAIAFESVVKLLAFTVVGVYVTFWLYDGPTALFERAALEPALAPLFTLDGSAEAANWTAYIGLAFLAAFCLPRQFQIWIVENEDERQLDRALWGFPLYLVAINLFVLPIALAGLMLMPLGGDGDLFVLSLPLAMGQDWIALVAFLGGLSAATSMVIVETIALSIMISNDLVLPLLLRTARLGLAGRGEAANLILWVRRVAIVVLVLLGFLYERFVGNAYALVSIGLVSFAAVAQFGPAILLGLYWPRANRTGAALGILAGFSVWTYTLLMPSLARSGWFDDSFILFGPMGIELLKPYALFGMSGLDPVAASLFWSMLANIGGIVAGSLLAAPTALEQAEAGLFVADASAAGRLVLWQGAAPLGELKALVGRFIGKRRAERAFAAHARARNLDPNAATADAELVRFAEQLLAGAIGAASARVVVGSVADEKPLDIEAVMRILDETSQAIEYGRRLEEKSRELEAATDELRIANTRLQELDRLKDDFVATVSHELRTPLTSIRSFSEILLDNPSLSLDQRQQFLSIVVKETGRLTRLINDLLDLAKIEAGKFDWQLAEVDLRDIAQDAAAATGQLFRDKRVGLRVALAESPALLYGDRDRLMQVVVNLLSNAVKFSPAETGLVTLSVSCQRDEALIAVADNGPGIAPEHREAIFERFRQVGDTLTDKPQGTGLGLAISGMIVAHHQGLIAVADNAPCGAVFSVRLPLAIAAAPNFSPI